MKTSKQFLIAAILVLIAMTTAPAQTTRYVAVGGSNNPNDCTDSSNPCGSVQYAHNIANSGDIIDIAAGEYTRTTEPFTFVKSITIQGAGQDITFLQAHAQQYQATHRVITIAPLPIHVEIIGLTIRHGVALGSGEPGRGGGIYYDFDTNNPGSLTITDTKIAFNNARVGGGVFSSAGSAPVFESAYFQVNNATERGGGFYAWTNSSPEFNDVIFQGNAAGITAGGIYCNSADVVFNDVNFVYNLGETGCGGLVLQNGSNAIITGSTFANNETEGNGGGMCMDGNSFAELNGVVFENNSAYDGSGGGMHLVNNSEAELSNVAFTGNFASGNGSNIAKGGGGMYLSQGSITNLENVIFSNNEGATGGGMFLTNNSHSILAGVSFVDNKAKHYGGAMKITDSSPVLIDVLFDGNLAFDYGLGGAIQSSNSLYLLKNVIFKENKATNGYGGAIHNQNSGGTYSNIVFSANEAGASGGAVYNTQASSPYLYNATFAGNLAESNGGGICNNFNSAPILYNTVFWGNSAQSGGNEVHNFSDAYASLYFSLVPNGADDVVEGAGYTCSDCITEDPLFANPATHHFQLTENSPAIDAGDPNTGTMPFPVDGNGDPIDILGNPRFFGSTIDIGAYEWNDNLSIGGIAGNPLELLVYPNPATDLLHIESKQLIEHIMVYDLLGKVLPLTPSKEGGMQPPAPSHSPQGEGNYQAFIDLSGLVSGVYIMKIWAGGQVGAYRIVKR